MPKHLMAVLPALLLTACAGSTISTRPSTLQAPPQRAKEPCLPTPARRQADGSATSADMEGSVRDGRFDLSDCESKRRLLLEAWPS